MAAIQGEPQAPGPRRAACGAFLLLLLACRPGAPSEIDLATLLERHTEARGGAEAIEAVESLAVELEIAEPEFTVSGRYVATRDSRMRIDIYAGDQRVFTEALGPEGGWQMHADGIPMDLSPDGEAALRNGVTYNLYGLHELAGQGFELTLVGPAERAHEQLWEIRQVAPDSSSKRVFLDAETYLVTREIQTRALHPDIDATESPQETRFTEYAASGGVLFANRMETVDLGTGEVIQTTVVNGRSVNGPTDPGRFLRPAMN